MNFSLLNDTKNVTNRNKKVLFNSLLYRLVKTICVKIMIFVNKT